MPQRTVQVTLRMTGTVDTTSIGADALGVIATAVGSVGGTEDQAVSSAAAVLGNPAMALEVRLTMLDVPGLINERVSSVQLAPRLDGPWVTVEVVDEAEPQG